MHPPQKLLSGALRPGESWVWKAADAPVTIRTEIRNPADVTVPADSFTATEITMEITIQPGDLPVPVLGHQTRWFVPGIGYVKQDARMSAAGRTLSHILLNLEKFERGQATKLEVEHP